MEKEQLTIDEQVREDADTEIADLKEEQSEDDDFEHLQELHKQQ